MKKPKKNSRLAYTPAADSAGIVRKGATLDASEIGVRSIRMTMRNSELTLERTYVADFEYLKRDFYARFGASETVLIDGLYWTIESIDLSQNGNGRQGTLVIRFVIPDAGSSFSGDGAIKTDISCEMTEHEQSIISHPKVKKLDSSFLKWYYEKDANLRAAKKYKEAETKTVSDLTDATSIEWADLVLSGVDSFMTFAPCVTRTSVYKNFPSDICTAAGKIETPPSSEIPTAGWQWLKTADRIEKDPSDRLWKRTEQWSAFETISTLIYEAAK